MPKEHDNILERALALAKARKPEAGGYRQAAFANSVATLVTGWSGGYGGPSVREHAAVRQYAYQGPGPDGSWTYEQAAEALLADDGPIFGPLTDLHRQCWREEHCFDDDPAADLRILEGRRR